MLRIQPIPDDLRGVVSQYQRRIQTEIALRANIVFGDSVSHLEPVYKYEGGITVNQKEIAIHRDYVIDDWEKPIHPSREEIAVAEAIVETMQIVRTDPTKLSPALTLTGPPLRALLRL